MIPTNRVHTYYIRSQGGAWFINIHYTAGRWARHGGLQREATRLFRQMGDSQGKRRRAGRYVSSRVFGEQATAAMTRLQLENSASTLIFGSFVIGSEDRVSRLQRAEHIPSWERAAPGEQEEEPLQGYSTLWVRVSEVPIGRISWLIMVVAVYCGPVLSRCSSHHTTSLLYQLRASELFWCTIRLLMYIKQLFVVDIDSLIL